VTDSNGTGIIHADVIFNVPSIVTDIWTNSSGYFETQVPAGNYHLNVWPPFDSRYINYDEPSFFVTSDTTKNITLYTGFKVSGYISDYSGTPMIGASILLNNFGSGWFSNNSGYYFLNVPGGTYTINAHPRTGNYYSGFTSNFLSYIEYNFTVNGDVTKNITVGNPPSTSQPTSTPAPTPVQTSRPAPPTPSPAYLPSSTSVLIIPPIPTPTQAPTNIPISIQPDENSLRNWIVLYLIIIISIVIVVSLIRIFKVNPK